MPSGGTVTVRVSLPFTCPTCVILVAFLCVSFLGVMEIHHFFLMLLAGQEYAHDTDFLYLCNSYFVIAHYSSVSPTAVSIRLSTGLKVRLRVVSR